MRISALLGLISLVIQETEALPLWTEGAAKQEELQDEGTADNNLELGSYDPNLDNYDFSNYEERAIKSDYGDLTPKTQAGTLAPSTMSASTKIVMATKGPRTWTSVTNPSISSLLNLLTAMGLPTCLICVCLGTSVYCEDVDLDHIPPLPQETTYLYARFNHITHIQSGDFKGLRKLKHIDLSNNCISTIEEDAFLLPVLQELLIPENNLASLPRLPASLVRLDAQFNKLQSSGILPESFKELKNLQFLYLSNNKLDYIPVPLPLSLRSLHLQNNHIQTIAEDTFCDPQDQTHIRRTLEDIRLDGNPINLSFFPNAYFCLPRLPIGSYI
ncbi:opticin [Sarcophilus harrisii]|uniref:Opticin n=1 Tax=Sarcophilus harrisii TaxID=9305 RepID=A0A7N4PNN2_SARHA|nr:opticin [Sarcophilus harrisii]